MWKLIGICSLGHREVLAQSEKREELEKLRDLWKMHPKYCRTCGNPIVDYEIRMQEDYEIRMQTWYPGKLIDKLKGRRSSYQEMTWGQVEELTSDLSQSDWDRIQYNFKMHIDAFEEDLMSGKATGKPMSRDKAKAVLNKLFAVLVGL